MRGAALCALALAACATGAGEIGPVPDTLRGCWIERRGEETLTMRWFPNEDGSSWRGDLLGYAPGAQPAGRSYTLGLAAGEDRGMAEPAWAACEEGGCRPVFFRDVRALARRGEWMELRATAERLVFTLEGDAGAVTVFDGARDGCD